MAASDDVEAALECTAVAPSGGLIEKRQTFCNRTLWTREGIKDTDGNESEKETFRQHAAIGSKLNISAGPAPSPDQQRCRETQIKQCHITRSEPAEFLPFNLI